MYSLIDSFISFEVFIILSSKKKKANSTLKNLLYFHSMLVLLYSYKAFQSRSNTKSNRQKPGSGSMIYYLHNTFPWYIQSLTPSKGNFSVNRCQSKIYLFDMLNPKRQNILYHWPLAKNTKLSAITHCVSSGRHSHGFRHGQRIYVALHDKKKAYLIGPCVYFCNAMDSCAHV